MPKEAKTLAEKADAGELTEEEVRERIDALKDEAFELEQLFSRIRAARDAKRQEALAEAKGDHRTAEETRGDWK